MVLEYRKSPVPLRIQTVQPTASHYTICGWGLRNPNTTVDVDDANTAAAPTNPPTSSTMDAAATSSLFSFLPYSFLLFFLLSCLTNTVLTSDFQTT
jgi:hypothetical protein